MRAHLTWYLDVDDKAPYVGHARDLYDLVAAVPHRGGDREHALALHHARQIRSYYEAFALPDAFAYRDARAGVFLADLGSRQELEDTLAATRGQVIEAIEELLPIVEEYAGEEPPFPGRAHLNVLFIHFIANFLREVLTWCDEAEAEVGTWDGTADIGLTPGTRRMIEEARAFYRSAVGEHSAGPA